MNFISHLLLLFRRRRDVACETSPIRAHDEVIKRYSKSPIIKIEPKTDPVNGNDTNSRLTKLEMNLKRFEDERRLFALEKETFEREKWHMEQMRFQRLLEFERKRSMQQREREQLAVQAAAIALAEIEKQRLAALEHRKRYRSQSKSRDGSHSGSNVAYADDYESSTATSSSSRDNDFNELIDVIQYNDNLNEPINIDNIEPNVPTIEVNNNYEPDSAQVAITNESVVTQSFLSRFIFGKAKPKSHTPIIKKQRSYLNVRVDDGGPISIRRIIFIESPLVWAQVVERNHTEWQKTMRLRNRCIANFVLLIIFFGFGGLLFRFIEGIFENMYKCGVRRVKRDFVDHLWSSSQDLRFDLGISFVCFFL